MMSMLTNIVLTYFVIFYVVRTRESEAHDAGEESTNAVLPYSFLGAVDTLKWRVRECGREVGEMTTGECDSDVTAETT